MEGSSLIQKKKRMADPSHKGKQSHGGKVWPIKALRLLLTSCLAHLHLDHKPRMPSESGSHINVLVQTSPNVTSILACAPASG